MPTFSPRSAPLALLALLLATAGVAHAEPSATARAADPVESGVYIGAGVLGASINGSQTGLLGGGLAQLYYETPHAAIGGDVRIAIGGEDTEGSAFQYLAFSLGSRWFPWAGDFTPFLGAGLVYADLQYDDMGEATYFRGGAAGLGGFAELGLAAFRTDSSRLTLSVRADLPFFDVPDDAGGEARYLMPISVAGTFAF